MNFFDYFPESNNVVNVFKNIDFGDILDSTNYVNYIPSPDENLMGIAYDHYKTIDDWWVLYYFNGLQDSLFAITTSNVLEETVSIYWNYVVEYNTTTVQMDRFVVEEIMREYYMNLGYDYKTAISMAIIKLADVLTATDVAFEIEFKKFITEYIVKTTTLSIPLKIPNAPVVYAMKTIMNNYRASWN